MSGGRQEARTKAAVKQVPRFCKGDAQMGGGRIQDADVGGFETGAVALSADGT